MRRSIQWTRRAATIASTTSSEEVERGIRRAVPAVVARARAPCRKKAKRGYAAGSASLLPPYTSAACIGRAVPAVIAPAPTGRPMQSPPEGRSSVGRAVPAVVARARAPHALPPKEAKRGYAAGSASLLPPYTGAAWHRAGRARRHRPVTARCPIAIRNAGRSAPRCPTGACACAPRSSPNRARARPTRESGSRRAGSRKRTSAPSRRACRSRRW